jgi:hypothetical protein
VDNARLYETEHAAVITLQHSLLPALPKIEGLQLAARYLVGVDGNQVGGDWYDVLPLPDGAVGVAVGDVVGTTAGAAAWVSCAACCGPTPGTAAAPARCSTAATSSCRDWRWRPWPRPSTPASSRPPPTAPARPLRQRGPPRPLLLAPDGDLQRLDEQRSPMIGAVRDLGRRAGAGHTEAQLRCAPGSLLLLYTDGFTDVAGEDADDAPICWSTRWRPSAGRFGRGRGRTRGGRVPSR